MRSTRARPLGSALPALLGVVASGAISSVDARTLEAIGHAGIEKRVADAYDKWVKEKGNVFRLRDGVDGHHGTVKLRWEMLPASGGEVISIGFDFMVLGDDGRIRTGYQFIEA